MKNYSTKLSGQIGENLLVAELGRRGFVASTLSGNVPDIDVLAYKDGKSIPIQVKTSKQGNLSVNADQYLNIEFSGEIQKVIGKKSDIEKTLIFVIIFIGENHGEDRFYICEQSFIQEVVFQNHQNFLKRHKGIRPKKPESTHCSYSEEDIKSKRDNWDLIEKRFK